MISYQTFLPHFSYLSLNSIEIFRGVVRKWRLLEIQNLGFKCFKLNSNKSFLKFIDLICSSNSPTPFWTAYANYVKLILLDKYFPLLPFLLIPIHCYYFLSTNSNNEEKNASKGIIYNQYWKDYHLMKLLTASNTSHFSHSLISIDIFILPSKKI